MTVPMGGLGGITYAAIDLYARRNSLTDQEFEQLERLVRVADTEQLRREDA